ncbi:MAG: ABC transporter ATP-binding protein [Cellulomonas sp.]|uniref:ABC transporter ATP-binding protein n=1 Tax=Cellulomonas gelida TaxID=1712 RepID=A0A4Y3KMP2_9CELL|nr:MULTISPECIES: ABC transporter ATP-binding protein [Cellulomonas]MCR6647519.1 ABC transporter ATP-binding protein [Cellulomonas sp.]MCR6703509.1 ABC transporter ATP-binding protein [Cellulomonas sp.]GEA84230.1 ABC transporter ATP-binding protein [Cellulomonas gelida]GGL36895.1 ABC transporter ATP-binding protein [Cellulomonas gelida]
MSAETPPNPAPRGDGDAPAPPRERIARELADVPRLPGAPKPDPIIVASGVRRTFGGIHAVDVEHLEVQRGAITALIGPNGAGKTTLFNLLTGFDRADVGEWSFEGQPVHGRTAARMAAAGMVRTFQLTKALSRMTVIDNMRLGATAQRGENVLASLLPTLWRGQEADITARAYELLERFKLDTKADDFAGSLSGGQRKLLEMARALMTRPTMVMLDEPMAGVNPALTQSLLGHIQGLRDEGMTVLFVEHDMHMVRHISDWVVVMAEGRIVAEGPPETIMQDQAVVDAYLGAHHDTDLGDDALLVDDVVEQYEAEAEAEEATQ